MNDLTAPLPVRTGPMPFIRLLDEAMRQVRRNLRAIYLPVAIPLVLVTAAGGVLQALQYQLIASEAGMASSLALGCGAVLMRLLQIVVLMMVLLTLQKAAVDAIAGRPVDMKSAWRFGSHPAALGTVFLQGLAIFISFFLCILPVFYVTSMLSLIPPVMAEEGRFLSAFSRSAELTHYNPRGAFTESPLVKAFVLFFVTFLISIALLILVTLVQIPSLIIIFRQVMSGEEPNPEMMAQYFWLQIPLEALGVLLNIVVYLYSAFGFALLYFDTRSRKEGSDLAAEIDTVFGPGAPAGESTP